MNRARGQVQLQLLRLRHAARAFAQDDTTAKNTQIEDTTHIQGELQPRTSVLEVCLFRPLENPLCAELAEMVVEVFVHQDCPLFGGEFAEEGVGMRGASGGARGHETIEEFCEALAFGVEVWFAPDDEFPGCG